MKGAPPFMLATVLLSFLTGSVLVALITSGITSFVHTLWARIVEEDDDGDDEVAP